MTNSLSRLKEAGKEIRNVATVLELLHWDQDVYLPSEGFAERADQIALMSRLFHQKISHPEITEWLHDCGCTAEKPGGNATSGSADYALLRYLFHEHDRNARLSEDLVGAFAKETVLGVSAWQRARKENEASLFFPHLRNLIHLTRERAEQYGYAEVLYDALLFDYEPELLTREIAAIFDRLEPKLTALLEKVTAAAPPDDRFTQKKVDESLQQTFNHQLLAALGFPMGTRGRFDKSVHPFTCTLGSNDVRITTRYYDYLEGIFATLHEFGHALYELQVGERLRGTLLAEGSSLTIHESQSRLWENFIGRSQPFWQFWYPKMQKAFPGVLDGVGLDTFWKGVNRVQPSLIRVSADELTYNLHIILRFRLEQALLSDDLSVAELPPAWGELSEKLLGIRPKDDREGMLQDVHWSQGSFGYFPTYALGNLAAAQFYEAISAALPNLQADLQKGSYVDLTAWLAQHIHHHGRVKTGKQLLREITGAPLGIRSMVSYLEGKYQEIYNF